MGGWMIGYSLPMELDAVLYYAAPKEHYLLSQLPPALSELIQQLPTDWRNEWLGLFAELPRSFSTFSLMAGWAGTLFEGDFRKATLPMRELRLSDAIERRITQLQAYNEPIPSADSPLATLQALEQQLSLVMYRQMGLAHPNEEIVKRRTAIEVERTAACLRDGHLHSTFWLLVDRFYYETYQPWRMSRLGYMEALLQRASLILGGHKVEEKQPFPVWDSSDALWRLGLGRNPKTATLPTGVLYFHTTPPPIEWLPQQNPIRSSPAIAEKVQKGKTLVYFWVEPFELFDTSFVEPGIFGVSFAEPGIIYDNFLTFVEGLSTRAQALADPTRLIIMRLIRHFSLDNTTMSNYMGISRPTVSEHARILREAGFIQSYQEGRQARHEVQKEAVAQFLRDLIEYLDLDIEV